MIWEENTSKMNHSEFHCGLSDFRKTSVLCVLLPSLISTYASVVSLDRSITGRFLPARIFTLTLPGILDAVEMKYNLRPKRRCWVKTVGSYSKLVSMGLLKNNQNQIKLETINSITYFVRKSHHHNTSHEGRMDS